MLLTVVQPKSTSAVVLCIVATFIESLEQNTLLTNPVFMLFKATSYKVKFYKAQIITDGVAFVGTVAIARCVHDDGPTLAWVLVCSADTEH